MKYNQLGNSDIEVSEICLGSMTWGTQNSEAEGHQQMDYALEHGVNFIDTAEMYPANPTSAKTQGRTEEIIGSWIKSSGKRDQVILATKVTGEGLPWVRAGAPISPEKIRISIEGSLMYRRHDLDLAELSHNEQVGLLPYSPLSCGMLSGKYRGGQKPAGSRITINPDLYGRVSDQSNAATDAYVDVAQKHGLDPSQMALAFCHQRPFVSSTIIGVTSLEQLVIDIGSCELELSDEVLEDIYLVYRRYPAPV